MPRERRPCKRHERLGRDPLMWCDRAMHTATHKWISFMTDVAEKILKNVTHFCL